MRFIGVEVEQETSAPPPKKNPGSARATSKDNQGLKSNNFHQCLPMDSLLYAIEKKLVQVIECIRESFKTSRLQ